MKRVEHPRPGDRIIDKVRELVDCANRRVEGPDVIDAAQGWIVRRPPLLPPFQIVPFELYDDFLPGNTDKLAWPLKDDYSRDTTNSPPVIKVSDQILGDVRAYGSHHTGWSSTRGAVGFYVPGINGKNQIISIKRLAKMLNVTSPSGSNTGTNATFTVTSCTVMDDGQNPCSEGASATITNWNQQLCKSVSNVICLADGSGGWRVIDADCPPGGGCA